MHTSTSIIVDPATTWPPKATTTSLAVLVSGGLDSAILLAESVRTYPAVFPIYIHTGAVWENVEREYLTRFLAALRSPVLRSLTILEMPVTDLYGRHWSLTGEDVPDANTPDVAVFLPGRNVILLSKALIWCHLHGVPELAMAPLAFNPFPDATPEFYDSFAAVVAQSLGSAKPVCVLRPYAMLGLHKSDVLRRGKGLPLELTFSCISPVEGRHCGECNKCAERKAGFIIAKVPDPTVYMA